ncbi:hypothetical protein [Nocardia huaxiensis]|uniref:Uncharacterized protein n=1 Tax=Nocardia huaxiensis TaxID=2755382 RepID=A0A7D6V6G9_9NOCA|nr:hypothetical protein [Nocardia huaxiensis]QLY27531.1 hypothetical protein H0264_00235 [Nocardia huaxiensis]UFS94394.1 hypothetical protein LPY97_27025 [Nocardia huaxiensis]
MTDVDIDAFILPELTGLAPAPASTPMHRAASQLQKVLPPGWRVEVVAVPPRPGRKDQPALRLVMSDL